MHHDLTFAALEKSWFFDTASFECLSQSECIPERKLVAAMSLMLPARRPHGIDRDEACTHGFGMWFFFQKRLRRSTWCLAIEYTSLMMKCASGNSKYQYRRCLRNQRFVVSMELPGPGTVTLNPSDDFNSCPWT